MKRIVKIMAVAALVLVSYTAKAELAPQWSKGTMIANANIGIGDNADFGTTVSLDYVLVDEWWKGHFTVGGEVGFSTWENKSLNDKNFGFTPRVTYGLNITPKFEVHAIVGMGLGFQSEKDKVNDKTSENLFITWNDMVGCRFFFTENFGVMAEAGVSYRMPELRIGFSIKL